MSRKVLDSNLGDNDVDTLMHEIIAQNPQLNAQIEKVHNESNVFLCKVLRIYPYEDKAYVNILNNNQNVFCRLSHEIMSSSMGIDYLPNGSEVEDTVKFKGKKYIKPYDDLYGIVIKVRWNNLDDENVLFSYVNIHDNNDFKSSSEQGELYLKSGSSSISVDDERVNIMTPSLFINGLPYNEPHLNNYYDKNETNIIINSLKKLIEEKSSDGTNISEEDIRNLFDNIYQEKLISGTNIKTINGNSLLGNGDISITGGNTDLSDYVKKADLINKNKYDIDLNLSFGLKGQDDTIVIDMDIVDHVVNKEINLRGV